MLGLEPFFKMRTIVELGIPDARQKSACCLNPASLIKRSILSAIVVMRTDYTHDVL